MSASAVLVPVERAGPPDAWSYTIELPHDPLAPRIARRALRLILDEYGFHELCDTAELLTSELATNAYRYSSGPSSVRVSCSGGRLRVGVCDSNPQLPSLEVVYDEMYGDWVGESDGGRGLLLLVLCADAWDGYAVELDEGSGKLIWFELAP